MIRAPDPGTHSLSFIHSLIIQEIFTEHCSAGQCSKFLGYLNKPNEDSRPHGTYILVEKANSTHILSVNPTGSEKAGLGEQLGRGGPI